MQTQLELESIRSSSGVVGTEEEPGEVRDQDSGELQATLQLVTELKAQLQSVREEMSEREKRHQAEVERLGTTAGEQQESDWTKAAGNCCRMFCWGVCCFSTQCSDLCSVGREGGIAGG